MWAPTKTAEAMERRISCRRVDFPEMKSEVVFAILLDIHAHYASLIDVT
jgi:hypothetical protein